MKPFHTTRDQYKAVKKFDRQQFDRFCVNLVEKGIAIGREEAPSREDGLETIEDICRIVGSVKGIGPAKLADIRKALEEEFIPKEDGA